MFTCRFFEALQKRLDEIPIQDRLNCEFQFSQIENEVVKCVEGSYSKAVQRLSHLAYYLEWARTLENNKNIKPDPPNHPPDQIMHSFHHIEALEPEKARFLNTSFSGWTMNQTMRELSEFLLFYLMSLYDICTITQHAGKPIKPEHVVDGRLNSNEFEGSNLKERLKTLKDSFGFELTHHQEVLSLYEARNVFSHFDGIVQNKFCTDNGALKIIWPVNDVKFKLPGQKRLVPYHRVRKPFEGGCEAFITWLNKPNICTYEPDEKIQLTYSQLNGLIFFYLYVFNELQAVLVNHMQTQGIAVKPFEEYIIQPKARGITVDGDSMELDIDFSPSDEEESD